MRWPWRLFERLFLIHLARRECDKLERAADMMRAAINANSNYDGKDEVARAKRERLEAIDGAVAEAKRNLIAHAKGAGYVPERPDPVTDKDTDDPLFAAMHRGMEVIGKPRMIQAGVGQALLETP